jgi:hypothetical protein
MAVAGCGEGTEEADAEARLLCFDSVVSERERLVVRRRQYKISGFGWAGE